MRVGLGPKKIYDGAIMMVTREQSFANHCINDSILHLYLVCVHVGL